MMNYYRICGMTVAAGLQLPGAVMLTRNEQEPDATIERANVPETLPNASHSGPTWQVAKGQLLLNVPKVARFLISDGKRIAFEPAPGRTEAELAIFVMGSAMGGLLHQRASFVLHASAVAVDGRAMLFCGQSGAGKSSLVAELSRSGLPFITDDVAVIQFEGGEPFLIPDGRRLKLWSDAIDRLSLAGYQRSAVRPGIEKYWVDPPCMAPQGRYPLGDVFFLQEARVPDQPGLRRLSSMDAVKSLRAHAYRPRLVAALNQEGDWFSACGLLTRGARAYSLSRELPLDSRDRSIATLQGHWRGV